MSDQGIDQLKEATKDILSEDSFKEIETAFNGAVKDKVQLHVEKALMEQDETHASKLTELLEAVDADHTRKLEKLVEAIDHDHGQKLTAIVNCHRNVLGEEAGTFKEDLIGSISKYLDVYLEQTFPNDMLEEAIQNKKALSFLGQLRKVFAVDSALANESIKNAVMDGKKRLEATSNTNTQLQERNVALKAELDKIKADYVLESKSQGLPEDQKAYVQNLLRDKDPQFIVENFEYTLSMFDKTEEQRLDEMKKEAIGETTANLVDRPVIEENVKVDSRGVHAVNSDDPYFNDYMGELGKY